ncbi:hypothetical protein KNP414_03938 [Paenibacillus mucilaginosus KNP414]|uniref:Uncharacterized protein n=1 Tax=Paenibacillus mucilaginosus (strain KNP414) TaxID=1036673 RepID=F8F928_PAEMK|nr:hypothetical protein KNP414_03938 [Paenibacillus mucilaginosus KNP414]
MYGEREKRRGPGKGGVQTTAGQGASGRRAAYGWGHYPDQPNQPNDPNHPNKR